MTKLKIEYEGVEAMTIERVIARLRQERLTAKTRSRQDAVLRALLIINDIHGPKA
jgi:hypothetical protein